MAWWKFWSDETEEEDAPDYYREGVELARRERYHEALTSFRLALREDPGDVAPIEQIGVVYTRIGMTDEAIRAYRQVLEKEPESPAAHYGLAFIYRKRGREEEAIRHLEVFLEHEPGGPDAREHVTHARRVLAELRGEAPQGEAGEDPMPTPGE